MAHSTQQTPLGQTGALILKETKGVARLHLGFNGIVLTAELGETMGRLTWKEGTTCEAPAVVQVSEDDGLDLAGTIRGKEVVCCTKKTKPAGLTKG